MLIRVHKYLFMGASKDKKQFFEAAQSEGIIEFISPEGPKKIIYPDDIDELISAIKILRGYVQVEQEQKKDLQRALNFAKEIVELKSQKVFSEEKHREIEQEIERIMPFGQFSLNAIKRLETDVGRKFRFFCAKTSKHLDSIDEGLILVNQKDGVDYYITIQNDPIVLADLVEQHFTDSLDELLKQKNLLVKQIQDFDDRLKEYTKYNLLLHTALLHRMNQTSLEFAQDCSEFELENQLFVVEGWVPETKVSELKKLCKSQHIYLEQVATEVHDTVPTYLENRKAARVGEDLVHIFDTPSIKDKDPSLWVLFAFAIFFSMVVYDAGYGLIFLLTALFLRFKLKDPAPATKRMISLLAILACFCTLWGGLTNSVFGIEFKPDSPIRKYSLMTWLIKKKAEYTIEQKNDVYEFYVKKYPQLSKTTSPEEFLYAHAPNDTSHHPIANKFKDNVLLELSLFIGAVHIIIGLIRYLGYNPLGAGWIAFIMGAYLYIPQYLHASSLIHYVFGVDMQTGAEFGLHLLLAGLVYVTVVGVIKYGVVGLFEFTHSAQVFADVLSYLRIYALGYAGLTVSETINALAGKMPLFFMILVLIFGHLLNIVIAILLGTIHGLRLNFLEWYRYSFYGGGKEFRPLELTTLE